MRCACTSWREPRHAGPRDVRARRGAPRRPRRHVRLRTAGGHGDCVRRGAGNDDPRDRRHPGEAFDPGGWEIWAPLHPLYTAGEYAEAADRGREAIESNTQYAEPLYNLACCESLAGRPEDAVRHLGLAIDRAERLRDFAKDDSDFDPIRDEPAFQELVRAES